MADWTSLPADLLLLIAECIFDIEDFITFGVVCKPWQSAVVSMERPASPPKHPWLMLADDKYIRDDNHDIILDSRPIQPRCFYSLFSGEVYEFSLPEASGKKCMGTGFGWLLTLGLDLEINLFHPFTRHQIRLPPQPTFSRQYAEYLEYKPEQLFHIFVRKAVLSSPPLGKTSPKNNRKQDCVVMAIYGEVSILAFARLGDKAWTDIKVPSRSYDDIVYYKGRFYAVDCHGIVVVCDLDDDLDPRATVIAPPLPKTRDSHQKYLVESSGDLLLVSRIRGGRPYEPDLEDDLVEGINDEGLDLEREDGLKIQDEKYDTVGFYIWKMEACAMGGAEFPYRWVEISTLGDRTLFLGNNSSVSLFAADYNGCFKANCLYFTDDNIEMYPKIGGGSDLGFYNMEDKTIGHHYTGQSHSFYAPPLWYL